MVFSGSSKIMNLSCVRLKIAANSLLLRKPRGNCECLFVRRADSKEIAEYDEQMKDFKYQRVVEITKKV